MKTLKYLSCADFKACYRVKPMNIKNQCAQYSFLLDIKKDFFKITIRRYKFCSLFCIFELRVYEVQQSFVCSNS